MFNFWMVQATTILLVNWCKLAMSCWAKIEIINLSLSCSLSPVYFDHAHASCGHLLVSYVD
ncbi:hypothetical protein DVH24_038795 [Malus domestica]|uniref:Uncharacterized protein n=1 Tax=Malus domestica TaxID=3750 RepID=A0A498KAQ0_MALDO|nr:hypothetical protein DVH24_038795 [Malus domestica]